MVGYERKASQVLPARSVLAVVDVDTCEVSVVSEYRSAKGNLDSNPRWSNDGTAFVFSLDHFEGDQYLGGAIAVIEQTGDGWSEPELLTEVGEFADRPDCHPTEDLIVFCTYDYAAFFETDEPSNLYTIRSDGSERTQITDFGSSEGRSDAAVVDIGRADHLHVRQRLERREQADRAHRGRRRGLEIVDAPENLVHARLRPTG